MKTGEPAVRIETGPARAEVTALSWDTEGTGREKINLLRPGAMVELHIRIADRWRNGIDLPTRVETDARGERTYWVEVAPGTEINWRILAAGGRLSMQFGGVGVGLRHITGLELIFPFNARVTATTILPTVWQADGKVCSPLLINAPDFGQLLVSSQPEKTLTARLEGDYPRRAVDLILELPQPRDGQDLRLDFTPAYLPKPADVSDDAMWRLARRGWFGALAPLSDNLNEEWTIQGKQLKVRDLHAPGMLGNEVISGNATCSTWMYADHVFWIPELSAGISAADLLRRTLDQTLKVRLGADGSLVSYWMPNAVGAYSDFLDSQPSIIIAAWDYVETTDDRKWLAQVITQLETIADFLIRRDVDGDGLIEAVQSGNRGTLSDPRRGCSWWDALNSGHKDGYCNALIYRAWLCLADLEIKVGRAEAAGRYREAAERLNVAFTRSLWSEANGWFGWWRSADGQLHDPASPLINAMAIEYGMVTPEKGREILGRLQKKMKKVGFTRFDLGVPAALVPIIKQDYLQGIPAGSCGVPGREDGSDTFGQYMNGGIHAGHTLHFLAAHYVAGEPEFADQILRAMLERQQLGLFQNGVWGESPRGTEWTTWDGNPSGADGYLADNFRFLAAILLREPELRKRFYRPLNPAAALTQAACLPAEPSHSVVRVETGPARVPGASQAIEQHVGDNNV